MYIIKARDEGGFWQHFNVDDVSFSATLEEIFSLEFTDIEVYARVSYTVEYSPGELWD